MKKIPVFILCGGMGTRLAEQTEIRPKPLVEIGRALIAGEESGTADYSLKALINEIDGDGPN